MKSPFALVFVNQMFYILEASLELGESTYVYQ
jgi:hypothetical protein